MWVLLPLLFEILIGIARERSSLGISLSILVVPNTHSTAQAIGALGVISRLTDKICEAGGTCFLGAGSEQAMSWSLEELLAVLESNVRPW